MVIIEDGGPVAFDIVSPDSSLHEGVTFSICEWIECQYKLIEFVSGWGSIGVGEMVPCNSGDKHMTFIPPGKWDCQKCKYYNDFAYVHK